MEGVLSEGVNLVTNIERMDTSFWKNQPRRIAWTAPCVTRQKNFTDVLYGFDSIVPKASGSLKST